MEEDLRFDDGDFQEDGTGDWAVIDGEENIDASLKRRMKTPIGDLFYDPTYGNKVFEMLGEDITEDWLTEASAAYRDCVNQDPRVSSKDVIATPFHNQRRVLFKVTYEIIGQSSVRTIEDSLELR